jgi:hypothetical protein
VSRRKNKAAPMSLFSFQDIITATTGILILLALVLALSVIIQGAESEIESDFADDSQIALRDNLIKEVTRINQVMKELDETASKWVGLSPKELQSKINTAELKAEQLREDIADYESALIDQQKQFVDSNFEKKTANLQQQIDQQQDEISKAVAKLKNLKLADRIVYNFRSNTKTPWLVQIADTEIVACKLGSNSKPLEFKSALELNRFASSVNQANQYFVLFIKPSGIDNYYTINGYLRGKDYDLGLELIGENQTVIDPAKGMKF